jgi:hypothetical protein
VTELDQRETKENVSEVRSGTNPIFAIFEGGGAKGIAHVGALPSMSRNQPLAVVALDTDENILASLQGNQVLLNLIIEATSGISALMTERRTIYE